jgi:hypothetical protein
MREYRIQIRHGNERVFHTDNHGRPYTYKTENAARKYGLSNIWVPKESARIVYADID